MSAMNTPPRKLLNVVKKSSASSPGHRAHRPDGAAHVDRLGRVAVAGVGLVLLDGDARQVRGGQHRQHHRDADGPAHAEQADRQPTEHRRDRERHAVDGPDETVRLVVAILGHEQRDRRRQGDRAQVPGDRAGQHEGDERPERRVARGRGATRPGP